jgi:outer membrane protein assembly factor BamE (lipoprotein component of BamABCDE complex)
MRLLIILAAAFALSACKQNVELPSLISPYRIDIQQGNVVTQEMVSKLKVGMTRSQVRFVLGSPLVTDMFHGDRWDYVYTMQKQGKPEERRRLTVIFDGDKLATLEGDVVLSDNALEPPPAPKAPSTITISSEPKPTPKEEAAKAAAAKAEAAKAAAAKAEAAKAEAAKAEAAKAEAAKAEAAKAEAAKAAAAKAEAGKAEAAKAEAAKASAAKAEAAKADAAKADATKAEAENAEADKADAATADTAKADAAKADAAKTDAAKADATKVDPAKADAAAADEKKDPPKRGTFGRMLDKIGF